MVRVSVIGASGYGGGELLRRLVRHPDVELGSLCAHTHAGSMLHDVFPAFRGVLERELEEADWARLGSESDVVFLALPHGHAHRHIETLRDGGARVLDLGADFRLKSAHVYESWYGQEHSAPALLSESVYGLTEWNRAALEDASLVAVPGCYPTATLLALLPLTRSFGAEVRGPIVVDAKSGVSGAGRSASVERSFSELAENLQPYAVASHRHGPEIEQELSSEDSSHDVLFVPHLVPMVRGILVTCYVQFEELPSESDVASCFASAYGDEAFVRVLPRGSLPQTKATQGSNFCDVAFRLIPEKNCVVVMAAIDNLVKGAAGQAIQDFNVVCGLPEARGIDALAQTP